MKAKSISWEMSYISLAQSQFHERCLSLKMGQVFPVVLKIAVICLKSS